MEATRALRESEAAPDPIEQFRRWFVEAQRAGLPLPHAMTLATATRDGKPSIRSVLLKEVDRHGFVFYTNYESRKARELTENPWAAIALRWVELEREVRCEGSVERTTPQESDAYFRTRPRQSQLSAWASPQSRVVASGEELERRMAGMEAEYQDREVPRPPYWGGYRLRPVTCEFWQGRPNRLHDRLRYSSPENGTWRMERLAP